MKDSTIPVIMIALFFAEALLLGGSLVFGAFYAIIMAWIILITAAIVNKIIKMRNR